ncbi:hypothetical protein, partial [Pseudoalteromonas sp.]|uniref:BACON domain-containing protein n=1 Tax=Pseudoalteromonas sp. TaxID=53249 RepID=UPI002606B966
MQNTSGGSGDDVTVTTDITGLSLGSYNGTVRISDPNASNNPVDVAVNLEVTAQLLSVSPTALYYGGTITSLDFTITNAGSNTLYWNVANPTETWITLDSPISGSLGSGTSAIVTATV